MIFKKRALHHVVVIRRDVDRERQLCEYVVRLVWIVKVRGWELGQLFDVLARSVFSIAIFNVEKTRDSRNVITISERVVIFSGPFFSHGVAKRGAFRINTGTQKRRTPPVFDPLHEYFPIGGLYPLDGHCYLTISLRSRPAASAPKALSRNLSPCPSTRARRYSRNTSSSNPASSLSLRQRRTARA